MELTALNVTPQGALLRWNPPVSSVDNYVLTLTRNQGMWKQPLCPSFISIICSLNHIPKATAINTKLNLTYFLTGQRYMLLCYFRSVCGREKAM